MNKTLVLAALLLGATPALAQPAPPQPAPQQPAPPQPAPAPAGGDTAQQPQQPPQQPGAPAPEDDKKAKAKALYEKGLGHYNLGEFDAAVASFKEAYALSSAPGLLFNIAQSFRLKKDYEQATYFYTTYLRLKPDAPNRADVEARLADIEKLIAEQKAMESKPPEGTVTPDGNTPQKEPSVTVNVVNPQTTSGAEGGIGGQSLMTAGLATAGAGGALLITGLVFGKLASSAESELNQLNADMGTWTQEHQDTYDAGKRNNAIAVIAFIAGGAAVATGGTLYVLGMMKKSKASVAITPTPGGTTASVGWAF